VAPAPCPMTRWRFGVLGSLVVERDGSPVQVRSAKQRALLGLLAVDAGRPVPMSEIVDGLWGDDPPATAVKTVQMFVSRLRHDLGPGAGELLVTEASGYRLRAARVDVDVTQVEDLVATGRATGSPLEKSTAYASALDLWRGPPFTDMADAAYVAGVRGRLDELHAYLVEEFVAAELELGHHAQVLARLHRYAAEEPLRENLQGQLVLALYRCGRQAEALEVVRNVRGRLRDELGVDLSPELANLERRILLQDPDLILADPVGATPVPTEQSLVVNPGTIRARFGSRRRLAMAVAAVVLVVAAGVSTGVALTRRDVGAPQARSALKQPLVPDSVVIVSPSAATVADLPVGSSPGALAVTPGLLWVGDVGDHTITEYELPSGHRLKTYGLSDSPVSLTPLGDQLWVGNGFSGTLSRILVPDQQLSAPYFPNRSVAGLLATAAAPAGLWVGLADRELLRLDPANLHVEVAATLPERVEGIAVIGSDVATIPFTGSTVRLVSTVGAVRTLAQVPGRPLTVCAAFGSVWVGTAAPSAVLRIDPTTGEVLRTFALVDQPTALACAASGVWVAEGASGAVERLPATSDTLRSRIEIGQPIRGLAADGQFVYVSIGHAAGR